MIPLLSAESVCLFLVSGHTFTFRDIAITCDNETVFEFTYCAMSDQKQKSAVFFKQHVAGISLCNARC